jgi:hypothetical protein
MNELGTRIAKHIARGAVGAAIGRTFEGTATYTVTVN